MELNGDIINVLITGLFSLLTVKITLAFEEKWKKREERKEQYTNKAKFKLKKGVLRSDSDADLCIFGGVFTHYKDKNDDIIFLYDEKQYNENEYIYHDYIFENIGKVACTEFYIVTNHQKNTSLLNYKFRKDFFDNHIIKYAELYDHSIEPGDKIKIRIYYHKDTQFGGIFSAVLSILFMDEYGNRWEQAFFEEQSKIYEPRLIDYKEYRNTISVDSKMEGFENPLTW